MDIVYQDKRILVVIKPSGVLSTDEPGGLPELIRKELSDDKACVRTVHRLDAQVGGLMVFARSSKAASLLSEQIREHKFNKEYLAVVHGTPPATGVLKDLLGRNKARRVTYVADHLDKDVRAAELEYEVLASDNDLSLVRIILHTGRTHQIRVQFSSRGWPLLGDRKYGIESNTDFSIALWSWHLKFIHPETNNEVEFARIPPMNYPWNLFDDYLKKL